MLFASVMVDMAWAETVYLQAKNAKLRAGKTSLDRVVTDLKFGEALEVVTREKDWLQVKTASGITGWIYAAKTSSQRPASEDSVLSMLGKNVRRGEAGEVTASAGARGLDKASETYADLSGITKAHRDAVDKMTGYQVSDQDVEEFLKEGKLGEYAQ
jgi:uncharacterized protein YgiM (DUF1202 family)